MAAVASHLADTSALARLNKPAMAAVFGPLIEAGLVATCGVIEFELGWVGSAPRHRILTLTASQRLAAAEANALSEARTSTWRARCRRR